MDELLQRHERLEAKVFPPQRRNANVGSYLARSRDLDPVVMAIRAGTLLEDVRLPDVMVVRRGQPTRPAALFR